MAETEVTFTEDAEARIKASVQKTEALLPSKIPAARFGGRRPREGGDGMFPVKVTKDGGSDGNSTTAASWTYTVTDLASNSLGTTIALARSRPKGTMTYGSTYGTGFYDGATFKLWDAGEVENICT